MNHIDEIVKLANDNEIRIAFNFCIDTGRNKEVLLSPEEKNICYKKIATI